MRRHLERLGSDFGLEKANKDLLRSMFSSATVFVLVYNREFQCEVVFSFWGFVKNDESRIRVLDFLFWCMQPRMYMAGETKQGHHVEAYFARKTGQSAYTAQHLRMLAQFVFR
jgi:hypothetical protein